MSTLSLFIFCIEAFLIQAAYSQCTGIGIGYPGGYYDSFGYGNVYGYGNYGYGVDYRGFGYSSVAPSWPSAWSGQYGGIGNGLIRCNGELPVAGTAVVAGQVPILGAVQFAGNMPAAGTVIITGGCSYAGGGYGCGCSGYYY